MLTLGSKQMKIFSKTLMKLYLLCLEGQLSFLQVSIKARAGTRRPKVYTDGRWKDGTRNWDPSTRIRWRQLRAWHSSARTRAGMRRLSSYTGGCWKEGKRSWGL